MRKVSETKIHPNFQWQNSNKRALEEIPPSLGNKLRLQLKQITGRKELDSVAYRRKHIIRATPNEKTSPACKTYTPHPRHPQAAVVAIAASLILNPKANRFNWVIMRAVRMAMLMETKSYVQRRVGVKVSALLKLCPHWIRLNSSWRRWKRRSRCSLLRLKVRILMSAAPVRMHREARPSYRRLGN